MTLFLAQQSCSIKAQLTAELRFLSALAIPIEFILNRDLGTSG